MNKLEDRGNGIDGNRTDFSQWIDGVWGKQKYVRRDFDTSERKGVDAEAIDKLYDEASRSKAKGIAGGGFEDQSGVETALLRGKYAKIYRRRVQL